MSQNNSVSCLPRRGSRCLGNVCGNSIDLEDVRFTANKSNLVYMDKVFSYNDATGCPLIVPICTCGENARFFKTTLILCQNNCGCGCGCNRSCNTLDKNAQFTVENSFVLVDLFDIAPNGCIHPSQVTVDGFPVDSICQSGGQFSAATDDLIPRIQKERCIEAGLPTKTFFLVSGAGPWTLRVRFILTGTVVSGGKCSNFRLEIESAPNQPNINLPINRLSNFAISDLSLPCITKGIAPTIRFQFGASAQLQNPTLTVNCQPSQPGTPCESCNCTVCLNANMVIEPKIQVEVVRKTLFCVNACEALIPCQGSIEELLSEEEEECPNPFAPDCRCGSSGSVGGVSWDDGCGCNSPWDDGRGCGNTTADGCGCGGNSCGSCGNNCGGCGNAGGSCSGSGCGSCGNNCGGCANSCGSCGNSGGGCGDHHHNPGIQPRRSPDTFQLNGCNGCSW